MRDDRKNEDYFKNFIRLLEEDIEYYTQSLPKLSPDRVNPVEQKCFLLKIDLLQAMYSSGRPLDEVRKYFINILDEIKLPNANYRYVELIRLFSLAVIFEVSEDKFQNINVFVGRDNVNDKVIDILRSHFLQDLEISDNLMHPNPYKGIAEAYEMRKNDAEARLKRYLQKEWYNGHRDTGWYNGHKSQHDIYAGYWSFETTALVKMKKLDDSSFRENIYYPKDLL